MLGGPRGGRPRWVVAVVVGALLGVLSTSTGCGGARGAAPGAGATPNAAVAAAADPACDPLVTLRPSREDGAAVRRVRERGFLIAGVDANSYRWGARNADTRELEGFDIDLVWAIARDILGPDARVKFVTMLPDQRFPRLQAGDVDLLVRTTSVTCARADEVSFSSVYFVSGHQLLVPDGSPITALGEAPPGTRICVGTGSSAVDLMRSLGLAALTVEADSHLDCLVMLQKRTVDGILTHASLAAGLLAQDPLTTHLTGPRLDTTLYGVAVNKNDADLVRRVNAVLEDYRRGGADSTWMQSYRHWLAPYLGTPPELPTPVYVD